MSEITSVFGLLAGSYDLAPFPAEIWTHIADLSCPPPNLRSELSLVNISLRRIFLPSAFESISIFYSHPSSDFEDRMAFLSSQRIAGAIRKCWLKTQDPHSRKTFDFFTLPLVFIIAPNLRHVKFESMTFRLAHLDVLSKMTNIQSIEFVDCDFLGNIPIRRPPRLAIPRLSLESMRGTTMSKFCFWAVQPDKLLSLTYSRCPMISLTSYTAFLPSVGFPNLQVLRSDPAELTKWWEHASQQVTLPGLTFLDIWYTGSSESDSLSTLSLWLQQPNLPSLRALSCGPLPPAWIETYVMSSKLSHLRIIREYPSAAQSFLQLLIDDSRHAITSLSLGLLTLPSPLKLLISRLGERGITSLELRFNGIIFPDQWNATTRDILAPGEQHVLPKTLKSCYLDFGVEAFENLEWLRGIVSNSSWSRSHPDLGLLCIVRKPECEPLCYDHQLGKEVVDERPSWLGEMARDLGIEHLVDTSV